MRVNLTKRDLVNLVYMQLGFSKQISENLIEDFLRRNIKNIDSESIHRLFKLNEMTNNSPEIYNDDDPIVEQQVN